MRRFNPSDWYWKGDPSGRADGETSVIIYSSKSRSVVATIPEEWITSHGVPYPWTNDTDNKPSVAALDELLTSYGQPPTGLAAKKEG